MSKTDGGATVVGPNGFEIETCSRCAGSGKYGPLSVQSGTCFRCGGKRQTLTKRGAAAKAAYEALCHKPGADVHADDALWLDPFLSRARWVVVTGVEARPDGYISLSYRDGEDDSAWMVSPDSRLRVRQNPEQRAEKLAVALAYQATLTAKGLPRKGRKAA